MTGLCGAPFTTAAAAASAAAFNKAMVWDLGRRPRTPLRTGRGGRGFGSRYEVCMEFEEEELKEEWRVADVEETGPRSAPGRVTEKKRDQSKKLSKVFHRHNTKIEQVFSSEYLKICVDWYSDNFFPLCL